jgi:Zn-dependent M16 (insulinase) family peptidase
VVEYYPAGQTANTENKTFLTLDWVIGKGGNQELGFMLNILAEALVNHESGPVKMALQDAGIGRDVNAYYSTNKQGVFHINVNNANLEDKDKFYKIVTETLKKVSEEGIDEDVLDGIINRYEFNLRENDSPHKGLMYLFRARNGWAYTGDPFLSLKWEKSLNGAKEAIKNNKLEQLIQDEFLNNPHSLLIALAPKKGLQAKKNKEIAQELAEYKASLSEEELESLIQETEELIAYQKKENDPEDLEKMPLLELKDIERESEYFAIEEKDVNGIKELYYNTFTNDIVYTKFMFDARVLTKEQIPYLRLLSTVLGDLNTENFTFGELNNELNTHLGGFYTSYSTYLKDHNDENLQPYFVVSSKVLNTKIDKLFDLTNEVLNNSKLDDKERLKTILTRHQARQYANTRRNGLGLARTRLSSYYSKEGKFDELTGGYSYYEFVTDLTENYDEKYEEIVKNLEEVASLLFNSNNMMAYVTSSEEDLKKYNTSLKSFVKKFPQKEQKLNEWNFTYKNKNEAMLAPSKVQYVAKGYNFKKLGYDFDGKINVLNQILSREWLNNQIRVIGGAYGGFCRISKSGNIYFASYRDPNLNETIENMDSSANFLRKFNPNEDKMRRFIIGTISNMDQPRSASMEGSTALRYYLTNTTEQELQDIRNEVLSTKAEDIKGMADFVERIINNSAMCVYGNEDKLKANEELFDNMITID